MICYKDRAFCSSDCVNTECYRYYDAGVAEDARLFGLPVSLMDFTKVCTYYLPPKKIKEE